MDSIIEQVKKKMSRSGLFALLFVGLLTYTVHGSLTFIKKGAETEAVVTNLIESRGEHSTLYAPVYVYTPEDGVSRQGKSRVSSNHPYHVGQRIKVIYQKEDPSVVKIKNFSDMWLIPTTVLVFLLVISGYYIYYRKKYLLYSTLYQNGYFKKCIITSSEMSQYTEDRRHHFYALAEYTDDISQQKIFFKSRPLPYDPIFSLKGKEVKVYFNRNNVKEYVMDDSWFPQTEESLGILSK